MDKINDNFLKEYCIKCNSKLEKYGTKCWNCGKTSAKRKAENEKIEYKSFKLERAKDLTFTPEKIEKLKIKLEDINKKYSKYLVFILLSNLIGTLSWAFGIIIGSISILILSDYMNKIKKEHQKKLVLNISILISIFNVINSTYKIIIFIIKYLN